MSAYTMSRIEMSRAGWLDGYEGRRMAFPLGRSSTRAQIREQFMRGRWRPAHSALPDFIIGLRPTMLSRRGYPGGQCSANQGYPPESLLALLAARVAGL